MRPNDVNFNERSEHARRLPFNVIRSHNCKKSNETEFEATESGGSITIPMAELRLIKITDTKVN